jgi:hypothetical protein
MGLARLVAEAVRALLRILNGERAAVAGLGAGSRAGWIASFVVPGVLLVPIYAWMVLRRHADAGLVDAGADVLAAEAIGYLVGWTAFPVISHFICMKIGKAEDWFGYIAAYNWANILQMAFYVPAASLGSVDAMPPLPLFLVGVVAVVAAIAIHFRLARVVLGIEPLPALMLVAVDLATGQTIARVVDRLNGL